MLTATAAALLESGMAEAVIGGALVAILEDFVGLVEFAEFVLAFGVARIAIRMMLHGELAECALQLDLGAGARDAENFVIVALRHADVAPGLSPHPEERSEGSHLEGRGPHPIGAHNHGPHPSRRALRALLRMRRD